LTAGNRFALNIDLTLGADQSCILRYDTLASRWRLVASSVGSGSGGGAPADATYVATSANGTLSSEQVRGSAVIMADVVASRPAAGAAGRLFWPTAEHILYRDDGAAWLKVGPTDPADMTERDYGSLQSRTHGNADHTTGVAPSNVSKAAAAEGMGAAVARADHKRSCCPLRGYWRTRSGVTTTGAGCRRSATPTRCRCMSSQPTQNGPIAMAKPSALMWAQPSGGMASGRTTNWIRYVPSAPTQSKAFSVVVWRSARTPPRGVPLIPPNSPGLAPEHMLLVGG
jgi:hypothetical protein